MRLPCVKGAFGLCALKVRLLFLTSTAFVDTKAKPRTRRGEEKLFGVLIQSFNNGDETGILTDTVVATVL